MRFGHPLELVSDKGAHFLNDVICDITTKYLINHRKTTPYNPKANGLTKKANGIIRKILNKLVAAHKTDWDLKLPSAVHAYNQGCQCVRPSESRVRPSVSVGQASRPSD